MSLIKISNVKCSGIQRKKINDVNNYNISIIKFNLLIGSTKGILLSNLLKQK